MWISPLLPAPKNTRLLQPSPAPGPRASPQGETEARSIMGGGDLGTPKVVQASMGIPKTQPAPSPVPRDGFCRLLPANPGETQAHLLLAPAAPGRFPRHLHPTPGPPGAADSAVAADFTGTSRFPAGKGPPTPLFTRGCYQSTEESSLAPSSQLEPEISHFTSFLSL